MDNQTEELKALILKENGSESFKFFSRPLTSKLLEAMELNKCYVAGEGDYLYYEQNGKKHKVLDLTGGYGSNILGHRHPHILNKVREWSEKGTPSLTQGSIREASGRLAKRISDELLLETSEGPWVTTFSNSGTESIEAAYKHSLLYYKNKLTSLRQKIEKEINISLVAIKSSDEKIQARYVYALRKSLVELTNKLRMPNERKSYLIHEIAHSHTIDELISLVREVNSNQISTRPIMLALEKAYHGKTMGALSLTYNESYRSDFFLSDDMNKSTRFISQFIDSEELNKLIETEKLDLIILSTTSRGIEWSINPFSLFAAAFAEPIQGEAGVVEVNNSLLANLKKFSLSEDFLLIFDEIQSGMYRTGTLTAAIHTLITPDIFTFSKSLGGGVAKIAATTINQRKYVSEFGQLHTSTFSDDDFSAEIALTVFDIIRGENSPLEEGIKNANYLEARLTYLKRQYPDVIKEIRGRGLFLAIEFEDCLSAMGIELKPVCDARMQGYVISSALLNHESLRMNPSLSNNLTLRIQPSLYFGIIEAEHAIAGLINVCEALKNQNLNYFLSAIYPDKELTIAPVTKLNMEGLSQTREKAVFLCHFVDESHVKNVSIPLSQISNESIARKLSLGKDITEFQICHTQTLKNKDGKEIDLILLGIGITSEELKKTFLSREKHKIVEKVQRAVDYAKELGANTVGLGQFTSIVSGNGLYLDSKGLNLTTGNAYTIALTVESALRSAQDKNLDLKTASASLIGAAGNIMSVATTLLADHIGKILTIHHSPIDSSIKYQESTRKILNEIKKSHSDSLVTKVIQKLWNNNSDLLSFLEIEEVKAVYEASSDLTRINETDIVLCGASASKSFLELSNFKENAIIVDIAVPQSMSPQLIKDMTLIRPDLTYHLGGVAEIPHAQSIDSILFPLPEKECFACMAETFSLSFHGNEQTLNIGDLNKDTVLKVSELAREAGFTLGNYKEKSSL